MRTLLAACVAIGVASAAFVAPANAQFGPLIPDGHRGPVVVPDRGRHVQDFRRDEWRYNDWRRHDDWRRREALRQHGQYCTPGEWGCRRW